MSNVFSIFEIRNKLMSNKTFFSPGKLMLTGEYVVLNGAKSLAIPTGKYGQFLEVELNETSSHKWKSYEYQKKWFEAEFSSDLKQIIFSTDKQKARLLLQILQFINENNPGLFKQALSFTTRINFNKEWGFGSSSSLLVLLYKWSGINPFILNKKFFGGSGYDIAVGLENKPLIYQLKENYTNLHNSRPLWKEKKGPYWEVFPSLDFSFSSDLKLVYLNKKQKSLDEIKKYSSLSIKPAQIKKISSITEKMIEVQNKSDFMNLIKEHEQIISSILGRPRIKEQYFSDFEGEIKSLGAWGGDFVLAIGNNSQEYFSKKSFGTILDFHKMLKEKQS